MSPKDLPREQPPTDADEQPPSDADEQLRSDADEQPPHDAEEQIYRVFLRPRAPAKTVNVRLSLLV